jgi:uncharacterized protein
MSETEPEGRSAPASVAERRELPAAAAVALYLAAWALTYLVASVAAFIAYQVLGAVVPGLAVPPEEGGLPPVPLLALVGVFTLLSTLLVTAIFVVGIDRRPFPSIGFETVPGWWAHWAAGIGLEVVHLGALFALGLAAGWYVVFDTSPVGPALVIIVVAFLVALGPAAVEEITMRGYILQRLERRYGAIAAVAINALLFAALHLANPGGTSLMAQLALVLAGVYFSIAYLATRQLWLPIAMHTAWNAILGPVLGLRVSGMEMPASVLMTREEGPALWTGGQFGLEAGLPSVLALVLFSFVVWPLGRRLVRLPQAP